MGVYQTIHTLELQRKIPLGEVSRWRGRLYELSERYGTGVYSKSKDEQEFYMYAQKGVTINLRAAVNCGFIKLTINLNSVLYAEPQRVVLFCPDKYYLGIFDRNLREILRDAGLGEAEEFEFSRVDFSAKALSIRSRSVGTGSGSPDRACRRYSSSRHESLRDRTEK